MAKAARKSPGVGRDQAGANIDDDAILRALAEEVINQEKMDEMKEFRKRARKRAEGQGVPLADLDALYKMRNEPISEVKAFFARRLRVFGAFFTDLRTGQTDMFSTPNDARAAIAHAGLMAGIKGEPTSACPPNFDPPERKVWLDAHTIGADRREAAKQELVLEAARRAAEGGGAPVDGTEAGLAAQAAGGVAAKAAADFKSDNPGVKLPGDEDFEMSEEERNAQAGRPKVVKARNPKGEEVDADPADPLLVEGVLYDNAPDAEVAKRRAAMKTSAKGKPKPQSQEAAEARAEAGVQ